MSKQPGGGHAGHSGQGGQGQSQNAPKKRKGAKHGGSSTPASSKHHPQHKAPGSAGKHHHTHHTQQQHTKQHPGSPLRLGDVSCCTFLAIAESARLAGWNIDDSDVLAAYFALTDDPDRGLDIPVALADASRYGIGPVKPVYWEQIPLESSAPGCICLTMLDGELHAVTTAHGGILSWRKFWSHLEVEILSSWYVGWPQ